MEMLFIVLIGASLTLGVRYLVPGRETYGNAVLPAVGAAVCAVVWAALTWLGWPFDGGWIWVISLLSGPVVGLFVAIFLPLRRRRTDAALLESLSRA